jgi:CRP-like cAMP-binding protein
VRKKQTIYAQGDACDAVFYVQKGKVRLTVVSTKGKEATIGLLNPGDFFGEDGLAGQPLRMGTATAMTVCELMRIDKSMFTPYLLGAEHPIQGVQLQRKETSSGFAFACPLRQVRSARGCSS